MIERYGVADGRWVKLITRVRAYKAPAPAGGTYLPHLRRRDGKPSWVWLLAIEGVVPHPL